MGIKEQKKTLHAEENTVAEFDGKCNKESRYIMQSRLK